MYKLLSTLYARTGELDRSHLYSAQALILQGKLKMAMTRYHRAQSITQSQDLHDMLSAKIERLKALIELYKALPS